MAQSRQSLGAELVQRCREHLLDASLPRLKSSLEKMTDDEIWIRPNAHTVSAGNLVLHLCGNVRQWIGVGLGGKADDRKRQEEFDERGPIALEELLRKLDATLAEAAEVLDSLDPDSLLEPRRVQGFDVTGVSILLHVCEHFSYHTGQITYIMKSRTGMDAGYYQDLDLEATE
jgi:uncharacterized damage-inducible protein DinB